MEAQGESWLGPHNIPQPPGLVLTEGSKTVLQYIKSGASLFLKGINIWKALYTKENRSSYLYLLLVPTTVPVQSALLHPHAAPDPESTASASYEIKGHSCSLLAISAY